MTNRTRTFLTILGLLALSTLVYTGCSSSQSEPLRVGVVNFLPSMSVVIDGFKARMEELGYEEGVDIIYIYDGPAGTLPELDIVAAEYVNANVDLILALSTPSATATKKATDGTDVFGVFVPVTDPVGANIVESLRHPGGNLTGVTNGGSEERRMEFLVKLIPGEGHTIYIPYNSEDASSNAALKIAEITGAQLGINLITHPVKNDQAEMLEAIRNIPSEADAIFLLPDVLAISLIDEIVAESIRQMIPLSAPTASSVEKGALISFGISFYESGEQAARLADQILSGTHPSDLPVETGEFNLDINLKTAAAMGLTIPDTILDQADQIWR